VIDEPAWLNLDDIVQLHSAQIATYGGAPGIRDRNALESTLARPRNLVSYAVPDIFDIAACYAFGLARNHCFVDGNKRVALDAAIVFLLDNGYLAKRDIDEAVMMMLRVAAGEVPEPDLARWFREVATEIEI
jgi:death-on-curing protein